MSYLTSTTSSKLRPSEKEYLCFQIDGKYFHESQCAKSRALTKVVGLILDMKSFGGKCVPIKGFLQSERLKQNMVSIGIDRSLSNS